MLAHPNYIFLGSERMELSLAQDDNFLFGFLIFSLSLYSAHMVKKMYQDKVKRSLTLHFMCKTKFFFRVFKNIRIDRISL